MMKRMFIPRTISQHKINNVDKNQMNMANNNWQTLNKNWCKHLIEKKSAKLTWENKTESIKAHIDMYKLTLHNVGYKNELEKSKLNTPP